MLFRRNDERMRLEAEVARQSAVIGILDGQIEKLFDLLADSSDKEQSLLQAHNALLEAHRDLQRRHEELRTVQPVSPAWSSVPMHMSEDEEDARYLHDSGEISTKELKEILKMSGFDNADIEFAN